MSRSTQFIGLNNKAKEFLSSINAEVIYKFPMTTGMFDEEIEGRIFKGIRKYESPYSTPEEIFYDEVVEVYSEFVQATPWHSGMMIFTSLLRLEDGEKMCLWDESEF